MTTVVDLHPEELLDRDARGLLSAAEGTRLEAHLARCAACRFERQLRGDFAEELQSDVRPSAVERLSLAGASQPRAAIEPPPESALPLLSASLPPPAVLPPSLLRRGGRRRVSRATWLLAAAAVCAVSVAGATGAGQRAWSRIVGGPSAAEGPSVDASPAHVAARHPARRRAAASPPPTVAEPAVVEQATVDVLTTPVSPALPARTEHRRTTSSANDGTAALFDAANDARRRGDYGRAMGLLRDLQTRHPHSRESHVSRATMGRLLLDRGDPAGALASFDAYLAGGSGELGEEAMIGRATALERLGRTADAGTAWQALLAAYPESPYAPHAKARLGSPSVR